ncbi:hypothetical protein OESDEN_23211, partial [Oesophagostomum dentatum]
ARDYPAQDRPFLGQKEQIAAPELQNDSESAEGPPSTVCDNACEQIIASESGSQDGSDKLEEPANVVTEPEVAAASATKGLIHQEMPSSSQASSQNSSQNDAAVRLSERLKLRKGAGKEAFLEFFFAGFNLESCKCSTFSFGRRSQLAVRSAGGGKHRLGSWERSAEALAIIHAERNC